MANPVEQFMRESDAFTWHMESDPALRATVVAVAWLDQSPDWDILVDRLDRATRLVPIFRERPVGPSFRFGTPCWTVDPDFDLTRHVRRIGAPAPHTSDVVLDFARLCAMSGFDAAHPPWEFTLVEDLEGGRSAFVMKLHHSLTDGIGGMQLLLTLFDTAAEDRAQGPLPVPPAQSLGGPTQLLRASLLHGGQQLVDFARHQATAALPRVLRAGRHPVQRARDVIETTRSVGRTVAPVSHTLSPVMKQRSLGRDLAMLEVGLGDLKRASAAAGGSVNDGFMAAVTGGFRRYHEHHGKTVDELRVTLPISTRTPDDPIGGNRITLERFAVPVSLRDPAARIRAIARRCRTARDERSVPYANTIAGALNLLPPSAVGSMLKHVDFLASNVPGFGCPLYLAGARVTAYIPFGPTIGAAVNVTLLSYDGTCGIGVTVDTAAVPDTEVFIKCLAAGFDEVLALAASDARVAL